MAVLIAAAILQKFRGQDFVRWHSGPVTRRKPLVGDTQFLAPFRESLSSTHKLHGATYSSVSNLRYFVGPMDISWLISTIIVDSIQGCIGWSISKNGVESSESLQSRMNRYAATSIVGMGHVIRIIAAGHHGLPACMGSSSRHSVGCILHYSPTPTRHYPSGC